MATALLGQRGALFSPSPPRLSGLNLPTNASVTANPFGAFTKGDRGLGTASAAGIPKGLDGSSEEGRVSILRSALARVRLEEDRATRAEIRASLMAISDPSSALPVSAMVIVDVEIGDSGVGRSEFHVLSSGLFCFSQASKRIVHLLLLYHIPLTSFNTGGCAARPREGRQGTIARGPLSSVRRVLRPCDL